MVETVVYSINFAMGCNTFSWMTMSVRSFEPRTWTSTSSQLQTYLMLIYSFIISIGEIFQLILLAGWLLIVCFLIDTKSISNSTVHLWKRKSHFLPPLSAHIRSVSTPVTRHEIIHNCCCLLDVIMDPVKPFKPLCMAKIALQFSLLDNMWKTSQLTSVTALYQCQQTEEM